MRIKVTRFYQDVHGRVVREGEHDTEDLPQSFVDYLISEGFAIYVGGKVEPTKEIYSPVDDALDTLRTQYFLLSGEDADGRWGIATLEKKIKDLK